MTMQVPDTCMFDGRKWAVEHWHGDLSMIPLNTQLGINTVMDSTANWSGRVDHFIVHRGRLYLLKVEVNLAEDCRDKLPNGANREVVFRYEKMWTSDMQEVINEYRFEYFVFHDLFIPYTGDLSLSYPCIDFWEQPDDDNDDSDDRKEMSLSFEDGVLIEVGEF